MWLQQTLSLFLQQILCYKSPPPDKWAQPRLWQTTNKLTPTNFLTLRWPGIWLACCLCRHLLIGEKKHFKRGRRNLGLILCFLRILEPDAMAKYTRYNSKYPPGCFEIWDWWPSSDHRPGATHGGNTVTSHDMRLRGGAQIKSSCCRWLRFIDFDRFIYLYIYTYMN